MVHFDIPEIHTNLAMSMTMSAFWGISWFIALELNVRLFYLFKRRRGLYFWSCALCSWGLLLHPLAIMLADFMVIRNPAISVPMIYVSWWLLTIPFSFVMYSRLYLIMSDKHRILRAVLCMIIFTTIFISLPSMIMGPWSQQPTPAGRKLVPVYSIWLKIENATWPVQEATIGIIYIIYTHRHLRSLPLFTDRRASSSSLSSSKKVMHHLIGANVLIITLDIAVMVIVYAGLFYLGGSMKPAVYAIKLRIEFSILNKLVEMARTRHLPFSPGYIGNSTIGGTWNGRGTCGLSREVGRHQSICAKSDATGMLVVEGVVDNGTVQQMTEVLLESGRVSEASQKS